MESYEIFPSKIEKFSIVRIIERCYFHFPDKIGTEEELCLFPFIDEMKKLKNINLDIAMLPIGGIYTMGVEEAALAANEIKAKITIPMHYKNLLGEKCKSALFSASK